MEKSFKINSSVVKANVFESRFLKKVFLTLFLCFFCFAENIFAFDFGVLIFNDTAGKGIAGNAFSLDQKDEVSAWIKIPFGESFSHYLAAECLYRFEYDGYTGFYANYVDMPLLKYSFGTDAGSGFFDLNVGRFFASDLTSRIIAQNADGCSVSFKNDFFSLQGYASYTGFLNGNITKMLDAKDFNAVDSRQVYSLADKYLNVMATVIFPDLFLQQTVAVQGIGSFRFAEKSYNRFYGTVSISGPVYKDLVYDVSASAGVKSYDGEDVVVSPFVKGKLSYYFSKWAVNVNAVFAGKDFTGITSLKAYNSALEPEYTDFIKAGISASVKPFDILLLSAGCDSVFDGTKNYGFKGIQYNVDATLQIASDVMIGAGWVHYIDMNVTEENYKSISLKAKIAM